MPSPKVNRRAAQFWKWLIQSYGSKFAEQFGSVPPPDWCEVIGRADNERLEKALMTVRSQHPEWLTLGQFEAAIPRRNFGKDEKSIPERLALHAVVTLPLCEHQLRPPWTYFGRQFDDGTPLGGIETTGVVIPSCKSEGCPSFGRPNHRVLAKDLPAQV